MNVPAPLDPYFEKHDDLTKMSYKAFTWNPDPSRYPSYDPRKQYECALNHLFSNVTSVFRLFYFTPELTDNGNIHMHGVYVIRDSFKYYNIFLPRAKKLGFVVVKDTPNKKWLTYLMKDQEVMRQVLGDEYPVPLTDENVADYSHYLTGDIKSRKLLKKQPLTKKPKQYLKKDIYKMFSDLDDEAPFDDGMDCYRLLQSNIEEAIALQFNK